METEQKYYSVFLGCNKAMEFRNQLAKTPNELMSVLNLEFKFDFDPCPSNPAIDGLKSEWGQMNFVNPPYKYTAIWVRKAFEQLMLGRKSVMLLPVRTHQSWFHSYVLKYAKEIRYLRHGLKFDGYKKKCPFALMIVVFT